MPTLLIRLAGPMQAWGTQSRFDLRDTGQEPSKSAVIGLLAAAIGRERREPIGDLAELRMGVRVLREGLLARDYHTVLDVPKASGAKPTTVVSQRYYLASADFLVALQHDDRSLLERLDHALRRPHWPLFLGRRAFPPSVPLNVNDSLRDEDDLRSTLTADDLDIPPLDLVGESVHSVRDSGADVDWSSSNESTGSPDMIRLIIELPFEERDQHPRHVVQRRMDQPLSFDPPRHGVRYVIVETVHLEPIGGAS